MTQNEKTFAGVLVAFGIPAVFWVYFDWRAALAAFVALQMVIYFAKIARSKPQENEYMKDLQNLLDPTCDQRKVQGFIASHKYHNVASPHRVETCEECKVYLKLTN